MAKLHLRDAAGAQAAFDPLAQFSTRGPVISVATAEAYVTPPRSAAQTWRSARTLRQR